MQSFTIFCGVPTTSTNLSNQGQSKRFFAEKGVCCFAASRDIPQRHEGPTESIACGCGAVLVILLKAFWTLFNSLVLFHEVLPIISPICCIFKIGVSPSSLVLHRLRPIRSADLKSQRASTGRPIGRSLISSSGAHPIVFFITQVLQVGMKRQESVLLIPATGFEDFTPGSLKCQHALLLTELLLYKESYGSQVHPVTDSE